MVNQTLVLQTLCLVLAVVIAFVVVSTAVDGEEVTINEDNEHRVVKRDACSTCLDIISKSVNDVNIGLEEMWDHLDGNCSLVDEKVKDVCYNAMQTATNEVFTAYGNGFETSTICHHACNKRKRRDIIASSSNSTGEDLPMLMDEQQEIEEEKLQGDVCKKCQEQMNGVQRYVLEKFHDFRDTLNGGCRAVDNLVKSKCFRLSKETIDNMTVGFDREFKPKTICQPGCTHEP